MPKDERKALIQRIQEKRKSKVVVLITGDRPGLQHQISPELVPILHHHVMECNSNENANIDLFLYSRGGDSNTPWSIVSMFREYCKPGTFSVLIPFRAHSAATVISLGADEIIMSKKAELGPIDITISSGPYNPSEGDPPQKLPVSVEDVTGYFALMERQGLQSSEEKLKAFELLVDKVHPLVLGTVSRLLNQTELVALNLLRTRTQPFPEEKNKEIMKRLSTEIYSHSHAISRSEAKILGLEHVKSAEEAEIADEMWQLYCEYRDFFTLESPFGPEEHLITNNLDESVWPDQPTACVESEQRLDVFRSTVKLRRLRQVPPEVKLSIANLALPNVTLQNPMGMQPDQIQQMVQQAIQPLVQNLLHAAVQDAANAFLSSLPVQGFERSEYNRRWNKEV